VRIVLSEVAKGRAERALPPTSTAFETGHATLTLAETEQRPTVLGLVASGRMRVDSGEVTIDGRRDARALRRRVALVDAPIVSEPEPNVTVTGVVAEELMFAGHAPSPFAAARWLEGLGLDALAGLPIGNVDPAARIRLLLELAALRKDVEGLVLVAPDRHGGEPAAWWRIALEFAERGYAVLVIAGQASQTAIEVIGRLDADTPTAPVGAATPASATTETPRTETPTAEAGATDGATDGATAPTTDAATTEEEAR